MALSPSARAIFETRRAQMFPQLDAAEIERMRRFGEKCAYAVGEALVRTGAVGRGLTMIVSGKFEVVQHDGTGRRDLIVTHGPGNFLGELAQLGGRPALVDANAVEPVDALVIPPDRLRALLVSEAELGER